MRSFFERLPKDRLLHGNEDIFEKAMRGQEGERTYTVSSSGAKLTYPYAIEVLARFAHSLVRISAHCHFDSLLTRPSILAIRERTCHRCCLLCDYQRQKVSVWNHPSWKVSYQRSHWEIGVKKAYGEAIRCVRPLPSSPEKPPSWWPFSLNISQTPPCDAKCEAGNCVKENKQLQDALQAFNLDAGKTK